MFPALAGQNLKSFLGKILGSGVLLNGKNSGQRGRLSYKKVLEGGEPLSISCSSNKNSGTGVTYSAGDFETCCQVVDKGAKSDALDDAVDQQFDPFVLMLFYV